MSRINILCSTDDKYVPWCGIMLTSVLENNPNDIYSIFILTAGLNPDNQTSFDNLSKKYSVPIQIITVRDELTKDFCVRKEEHYISVATWYRLLAANVLPDEIEKVLYLDCDIIVNGSLSPLWNKDLAGYAIAGVPDESSYQDELFERLGYPKSDCYLNAGVLLINLNYWREHQVLQRCKDFLLNVGESLVFYDQDTLNKVLHRETLIIEATYNFQNGYLLSWQIGCYDEGLRAQIRECYQDPCIIHFSGRTKPWQKECYSPYISYFLYYLQQSLWCATPLTGGISFKERVRRLLHFIAEKFNLKQPLYWTSKQNNKRSVF